MKIIIYALIFQICVNPLSKIDILPDQTTVELKWTLIDTLTIIARA